VVRVGGRDVGITRAVCLSGWLCGSEVFEEREQRVGWAVAAWLGAWWGGAVDRALFEGEVGVQVDLRRLVAFVAEPERDRGGVDRGLQQPDGGGVPKGVWCDLLVGDLTTPCFTDIVSTFQRRKNGSRSGSIRQTSCFSNAQPPPRI
jgi:hypothetical protein